MNKMTKTSIDIANKCYVIVQEKEWAVLLFNKTKDHEMIYGDRLWAIGKVLPEYTFSLSAKDIQVQTTHKTFRAAISKLTNNILDSYFEEEKLRQTPFTLEESLNVIKTIEG